MKLAITFALIAGTALAGSVAFAHQKTVYVAGYGGSYEQTMRKEVIPAARR